MTFPSIPTRIRPYVLLLFGAALLIPAFPKVSWSFLAWIAFLPFFKVLENSPAGQRFRQGMLFGIAYSLGVFYWVTYSMRHYGGLDWFTSLTILLLMVLYLALYTGAFAWLWGFFPAQGLFPIIWVPSVWVGLEFLRAHLLTGFPWELLGHSQYNFSILIQIAEVTGVFGISFLILLVNQTLFQLFLAGPFASGSRSWREAIPALSLVMVTLLFGFLSLGKQEQRDQGAQVIKVAVIQGNIDQSVKWNPTHQERTIAIYKDLTSRHKANKPDLVIWPETAVPFYFLNENRFTPQLFQLARESGTHLLFGSPAFGYQGGKMHYFNRAYLMSPDGRLSFYDKVHLVPFGEYIPMKKFLPFVGKMVEAIGDFSPGSGSRGLSHPKGNLGVLICFETIFPELSRAYNQEGCRLLINMTNDAWFGKTSAPYQHLSMLTFRAVENRLWVARAANTGFSAIIDSAGRIKKSFPLFQTGGIYATIPLREEKTFYSRYGDLLVGFSALIFLSGLVWKVFAFKRGHHGW